LELDPRQHPSPWIIEQAIALVTLCPVARRQTCLLASLMRISTIALVSIFDSLYRWVQNPGAKIVHEEDELQQSVLYKGVIPPLDFT
jgi:hypothetical protein